MFHIQNHYFQDTFSISMMGFNTLYCMLSVPNSQTKLSLHCWLLTITLPSATTELFTSIDVDPNNVYSFCTNRANQDKAIIWLDNLCKLLCTTFSFEDLCLICKSDNTEPSHSYWEDPANNTDDAVGGFDKVLNGGMDTVDDNQDTLAIAGKLPPTQFTHSFAQQISISCLNTSCSNCQHCH
eukprot:8203573-Ditylum_brightwellii.AAC.1